MSVNKKNILVLTSWSFNDPLIQTYTLPYLFYIKKYISADSKIYLYTQTQESYFSDQERNEKMVVRLEEHNIFVIKSKYRNFGLLSLFGYIYSFLKLFVLIFFKKIDALHAWCTPAGSMGYLLSVFTGRKLILDSFEPHAQPMVEGGTWKKNGWAYKILFFFEKKQLEKAYEVICAVAGMEKYSQDTYGIKKERYFSKPACVDLELFSKNRLTDKNTVIQLGLEDKIVCVYAGKFGGLYLTDETFDFFKAAYKFWGHKFRVLLLSGHSDAEISEYVRRSGLPDSCVIKKRVQHDQVPQYLALANFAICPMKPLPSRRYGTPIKNGEYWAMGLPVVITKNISDDSDIIKEYGIGAVLENLDEDCYRAAIRQIDDLLKKNSKEELYRKIRHIAEKYRNFSIADKVYSQIYGS